MVKGDGWEDRDGVKRGRGIEWGGQPHAARAPSPPLSRTFQVLEGRGDFEP